LPNVIKASEYVSVKNGNAFPANNKAAGTKDSSSEQMKEGERGTQEQHLSIVDSAKLEAQQIIDAAQAYSMNKVREATQQMNGEATQVWAKSHEDGYQKGFNEGQTAGWELGYKDGYEEGVLNAKAENQAVLDELISMIASVETMKAEILQKFQNDIKKLAAAIAEKVIRKELSVDAQAMHEIIKHAVDNYVNQDWIKIIVSKDTKLQLLNADQSIIDALRDISENIRIEASADLKNGDCMIDLPNSMVDAGVDTQMAKIKQALEI
jgi:flagellar assembly protein FliH